MALPDVPLDPAGHGEAALLEGGQVPGVREAWSSNGWRLFRVTRSRPLASPPATVTALNPYSVELRFARPGVSTVRVRFSPYWRPEGAAAGGACVSRAPGGWTRVSSRRAGPLGLGISFSPARIGASGPRCSG